ncbi:hypothetical protein F5888DRAFT_1793353 [Russula emetica]|nr:hypothetical protein F5888DRAFT_1793353 [Russula emetica]
MELMAHLELAMDPNGRFKALGHARREQLVRRRVDLPLLICGEDRHAKAGVCIINHSQNDILLPINARAQLVAEAVAAFNKNNIFSERLFFLDHARYCYCRHVTRVLQNSHHPNSLESYSPWDLSGPPEETHGTHEILKCYEAFEVITGI